MLLSDDVAGGQAMLNELNDLVQENYGTTFTFSYNVLRGHGFGARARWRFSNR